MSIIDNFSVFFSPMLTRMEGSANINSDLRLLLHIAEPNPKHTTHKTEITEACYVKVVSTVGEKVQLKCSAESDTKRPSMLQNQGTIEIEVLLGVKVPTTDTNGRLIAPASLTGHDDTSLTIRETSTKASFYLATLPDGSAGKTLQGYARWRDVHNIKRTGPWTPIPPVMIT